LLAGVISSVAFKRTGADDDELLTALRMIAGLASSTRRWVPTFSPSRFIDQQWRTHVVDVAHDRLERR
jgi:hypothetical protein